MNQTAKGIPDHNVKLAMKTLVGFVLAVLLSSIGVKSVWKIGEEILFQDYTRSVP